MARGAAAVVLRLVVGSVKRDPDEVSAQLDDDVIVLPTPGALDRQPDQPERRGAAALEPLLERLGFGRPFGVVALPRCECLLRDHPRKAHLEPWYLRLSENCANFAE